jgi:hypothetical protein
MAKALKLIYLPLRGRAEALRIYLKFCQLAYVDDIVDYDAFSSAKNAGEYPFDQARARMVQLDPATCLMWIAHACPCLAVSFSSLVYELFWARGQAGAQFTPALLPACK